MNRKDIKYPVQAPNSCQCRYLGPEYAEIRARFYRVSDAQILRRWRALRVRLFKLGIPERCRNIYRLDNPYASNLAIATLTNHALRARRSMSPQFLETLRERNEMKATPRRERSVAA